MRVCFFRKSWQSLVTKKSVLMLAPCSVVFWLKQFNCQQPNGHTNYRCKLISWFKLSTGVTLPKHLAWLLNWEKVHVLGRHTREWLDEWDWVYGNELNVLLLLGRALWIPIMGMWPLRYRHRGFTFSLPVSILMWIYDRCHTWQHNCG